MKQYNPDEDISIREVKVIFQRKFRMEEDEALLMSRYIIESSDPNDPISYDDERKIPQADLIHRMQLLL